MATVAPPIPRVELAYAPTPLLKLERLSAELGLELWVKRDDLTGLLETGNKIRKLEFLVGELARTVEIERDRFLPLLLRRLQGKGPASTGIVD